MEEIMSNQGTLSAEATTWTIDPAHTQVGFEVKHMMFAKVRGQFDAPEGEVHLGADGAIEESSVEVAIDAASIDTGVEDRDKHLRSADFLDVENYPKLHFVSREVRSGGGDQLALVGDLTIRGKTREVELEVESTGRGTDPWGNERAGFSASTTIDRRDFGLTWNQALEAGGVLVGHDVKIEIEIQAVLQDG
jgi:polyisoprenoid-binding protein YceI